MLAKKTLGVKRSTKASLVLTRLFGSVVPKACMTKWCSIRDFFKKTIKEQQAEERSGAGSKKRRLYKFHYQLEWLLNVNKKRA